MLRFWGQNMNIWVMVLSPYLLHCTVYCTSLHSTSKIYIIPLHYTVKHCTALYHDLKEYWKHARIQTAQVMVTPTPSSSAWSLFRVRWSQVYCRVTEWSRILLNKIRTRCGLCRAQPSATWFLNIALPTCDGCDIFWGWAILTGCSSVWKIK